jgi:3',5'-cyclic AMP phosphodiesterase CpdA
VFHHPFDSFEQVDEKNLIRRSGALLEVLTRHRVDLVLGGHIHDALARTTEHRYPRLDRHLILALAGTSMSWRTRYRTPNTFNLLHLAPEAGELTVERWDCQPGELEAVGFHPVARNSFARDAGGSWNILPGR